MTEHTGGTVRYHRAEYDPERGYPWMVWFTENVVYNFTAAEGEAMGLTPPEPEPLVVTCNGHSIELSRAEASALVAASESYEWEEVDAGDWRRTAAEVADLFRVADLPGLLRDARQDPQPPSDRISVEVGGTTGTHNLMQWCIVADQPASDPEPYVELLTQNPAGGRDDREFVDPGPVVEPDTTSDTLDFDALADLGEAERLRWWADHPARRWEPLCAEDMLNTAKKLDAARNLARYYRHVASVAGARADAAKPAPVSPCDGLRAVLAGRDDADELIEYAAATYKLANVSGPGRELLAALGDAARSGGAS